MTASTTPVDRRTPRGRRGVGSRRRVGWSSGASASPCRHLRTGPGTQVRRRRLRAAALDDGSPSRKPCRLALDSRHVPQSGVTVAHHLAGSVGGTPQTASAGERHLMVASWCRRSSRAADLRRQILSPGIASSQRPASPGGRRLFVVSGDRQRLWHFAHASCAEVSQ